MNSYNRESFSQILQNGSSQYGGAINSSKDKTTPNDIREKSIQLMTEYYSKNDSIGNSSKLPSLGENSRSRTVNKQRKSFLNKSLHNSLDNSRERVLGVSVPKVDNPSQFNQLKADKKAKIIELASKSILQDFSSGLFLKRNKGGKRKLVNLIKEPKKITFKPESEYDDDIEYINKININPPFIPEYQNESKSRYNISLAGYDDDHEMRDNKSYLQPGKKQGADHSINDMLTSHRMSISQSEFGRSEIEIGSKKGKGPGLNSDIKFGNLSLKNEFKLENLFVFQKKLQQFDFQLDNSKESISKLFDVFLKGYTLYSGGSMKVNIDPRLEIAGLEDFCKIVIELITSKRKEERTNLSKKLKAAESKLNGKAQQNQDGQTLLNQEDADEEKLEEESIDLEKMESSILSYAENRFYIRLSSECAEYASLLKYIRDLSENLQRRRTKGLQLKIEKLEKKEKTLSKEGPESQPMTSAFEIYKEKINK